MARAKKTGDTYNLPFPKNLRALMDRQPDITQDKLAEITGKTRQTISQYVNGISEPGFDTLVKIADFFDCSIDYLLGRTEDSKRTPSSIDELGISEAVAENFTLIADGDRKTINNLLEKSEVWKLLFSIGDYITAVKADNVYSDIAEHNNQEETRRQLLTISEQYFKNGNHKMSSCICAILERDNEFFNRILFSYDDEDEGFYRVTDLIEARINRRISKVLHDIRENTKFYENNRL